MEDSMEWSGDLPRGEKVFPSAAAPSYDKKDVAIHSEGGGGGIGGGGEHSVAGVIADGGVSGGLDLHHSSEGTMMDGGTMENNSSDPANVSDSSSSSTSVKTSVEGENAAAAGGSGSSGGGGGGGGDFLCYECGLDFRSVKELQLHMVRKTAWSNQGLIGCRVSCLVENREWHEGLVTQYHKSGKHCVEFRRSGEKRWVNMLKTAFYIVERSQPTGGEVKEMEPDPTPGLAPIEKWHYQENISLEFCVALSLLHRAYGCRIQETGHKTVGHTCVTDRDKVAAREVKGSLLYGELLPRGVNKAMGPRHLNASKARTVYDLGMGTGKVAMQVFLQFPNLTRVYGIELSQARFELGETALFALMELQPGAYAIKRHIPGQFISIETLPHTPQPQPQQHSQHAAAATTTTTTTTQNYVPFLDEGGNLKREEDVGGGGERAAAGARAFKARAAARAGGSWDHICRGAPGRTLEFACGNLFDVSNIAAADVVLLETDVSSDVHPQLSRFLTGMRKGSQALTYLDLRKMWSNLPFPYRQVEVNRSLSDRFPTSWSVQRGHHFFLWSKNLPSLEGSALPSPPAEDKEVLAAAMPDRDSKRRERQGQGAQQNSDCLRITNSGGAPWSRGGGGEVGGGTAESARGSVGLAGEGDAFGAGGRGRRGGGAQRKGRRGGNAKFRLPFFSCLGLGRKETRETPVLQEAVRDASVHAVVPSVAIETLRWTNAMMPAMPETTAGIDTRGGEVSDDTPQNGQPGEPSLLGGDGGGGGGGSGRIPAPASKSDASGSRSQGS